MSLAAVSNAEILISKMVLFGGVSGKLLDKEYRSFLSYISDNTVKTDPPGEDMGNQVYGSKSRSSGVTESEFWSWTSVSPEMSEYIFVVPNLSLPGIVL